MSKRHILLGVLGGALVLGVPATLAMESRQSELADLALDVDDPSPSIAALRDEIQRLRARLASQEARTDRERLELRTGRHLAPGSAERDESVGAEANGASRMPELLAELRDLVESGALETRFKDPSELLEFLAATWLEAGVPDRAIALLSRFEMDEDLAKYALAAVDQMQEKGDRSAALHACLLLARSGHHREELVSRALALDAERVLEELDAAAIEHGKKWDQEDWPAQRGALLLAAGETKAALTIIDGVLKKAAELPAWMWPQLVEKVPKESESRLRAMLLTAKKKDTRHTLQQHLALALKRQGRSPEAVEIMRKLIDAEIGSDEVVDAFRDVDRSALADWLEKRVRTKPCARSLGLYGDSLLATKQKRHAIAAWWEAVKLTPDCDSTRKLIEHDPHQAIMRLTRPAQDRGDDELIGDIADALWRMGKRNRARDLWQQALEFDSDDSEWSGKLEKVKKGLDPMR